MISKMLISLLVCLLLSNAVSLKQDKSILFSRIVIKGLLVASLILINNFLIKGLEKGIGVYGGLFNITTSTQIFHIFILLISGIILTLNAFFPRKVYEMKHSSAYKLLFFKFLYNKGTISNKEGKQFRIIEYPLIIVFIICGALFLICAGDLVSIFLSIELQSYGLYVLSTLYRDSESATGSGLTYFLLGGLSSCFILLGSGLLYANSGTTNMDNIYVITSISEMKDTFELLYWYQPSYIHFSLIVILVGFLFKISAAPFHFWSPDVYDGIPTIVTTYVAIVTKISILAFLLELVYYTNYFFLNFSWKSTLLISSLLSLIIGSVLGLSQSRIKRLLAYSTISHVGFILLALSINSTESVQSYIFYILQYSISNLNAFVILVTIGFSLYFHVDNNKKSEEKYIDKNNSPIQLISQIKGYFYLYPFIAISLSVTLFSFVGVPPLIGFFAKQMVLSAALDNGYIIMALVGIITSVIAATYYLNLINQMFFVKADLSINSSLFSDEKFNNDFLHKSETANEIYTQEKSEILERTKRLKLVGYVLPVGQENIDPVETQKIIFTASNIRINSSLSGTISVITLLLITFIYTPGEWFNFVSILSLILFQS